MPVARLGRPDACNIRAEAGCAPTLQPTPNTVVALRGQEPGGATKVVVYVRSQKVEDGLWIRGISLLKIRA